MILNYILNIEEGIVLLKDFGLSSLDTFKKEVLEVLNFAEYNDIEDMV